MKTMFIFHSYVPYDDKNDHGFLAAMETTDGIPVNVFAEPGSSNDLQDGDTCEVLVYGVCSDLTVYTSEEQYRAADTPLDVIAMIPAGTFSPDPENTDFKQSPWIIYSGKIIQAQKLEAEDERRPNYFIVVETLGMTIGAYTHFNDEIEPGYVVHGTAWLYGVIEAKAA